MKRKRGFFGWRRKPTLMDRVEEWLPEEITARIPEQVDQALRKRLDHIDVDKLEAQLAERLGRVDRAKLEALLQAGLDRFQPRQAVPPVSLPDPRAAVTAVEQATKSVKLPKSALPASKSVNPVAALVRGTGSLAFFTVGAWLAYSYFLIEHQVSLPKALVADQTTLAYKPTGPICLYRDVPNQARPLLLVHSVNAAASSFEMRPIFQHFRTQRPTYALDLPGYGFSARTDTAYTPATFVQAILTAAEHIYAASDKTPVDVVALSLGAEFAAEAARQRPDLIRGLALISPSGMQAKSAKRYDEWLYPVFTFGLWARPFFDLLATKRSINYFLARSFVGVVPQDMVEYAYATAHQPDAEHAPLAFVSGRLFTTDAVERIYRKVEQPTLVIHDEDAFVSFERLTDLVATLPNWQSARVTPTKGLPHWEKPVETNRLVEEFLDSLG